MSHCKIGRKKCMHCHAEYNGRMREYAAQRRELAINGKFPCECGRGPKETITSGCTLCNALDGKGTTSFDIIQALRSEGGSLTTSAVANELRMKMDSVLVRLNRMAKIGLVTKRVLSPAQTGASFSEARWAIAPQKYTV